MQTKTSKTNPEISYQEVTLIVKDNFAMTMQVEAYSGHCLNEALKKIVTDRNPKAILGKLSSLDV